MNEQQKLMKNLNDQPVVIAVLGLGYVGLPPAVEFSKKYATIGFDISTGRIAQLNAGLDKTLEVAPEELQQASNLRFTNAPEDIAVANVFIITVPTPIDKHKRPDLAPLQSGSVPGAFSHRVMPRGQLDERTSAQNG